MTVRGRRDRKHHPKRDLKRENKAAAATCRRRYNVQSILENKETPAGLPNKSRSIRRAFKPVWVGIRVRRMRESLVASARNRCAQRPSISFGCNLYYR